MAKEETLIEEVFHKDIQIALIIRSEFQTEPNTIKFFTPDSFSQQIGLMKRPKGYKIKPHIHQRIKREVLYTNEVLLVKKGLIQVDFYDESKKIINSKIIKSGDILLLIKGGHGFTILEESEIYEIKQGPYVGEEDKLRF